MVNSHPPFVYVENHRVVGLVPEDPFVYGQTQYARLSEKRKLDDIGGVTSLTPSTRMMSGTKLVIRRMDT